MWFSKKEKKKKMQFHISKIVEFIVFIMNMAKQWHRDPERLWNLSLWRDSKLDWMELWGKDKYGA